MTDSPGVRELAAHDLLRAALDVSPDGFAVHRIVRDDNGEATGFTLQLINRAGAAPFTSDPGELAGADVATLLGPSSEPMLAAFRRCARTGSPQRFQTTFAGSAAAGTTDSVVVRLDDDHLLSTWRDVTEQIATEELLEEALRQRSDALHDLQTVLDAMSDAVAVVQPEGGAMEPTSTSNRAHLVYVNRTAADALGISVPLAPHTWLDALLDPPAAEWLSALIERAILESPGEATAYGADRNAAGRVQDARVVSARALPDGRVLIVSRDVTRDAWAGDDDA